MLLNFKLIIQLLPYFIKLFKTAQEHINSGQTIEEIGRVFSCINQAFAHENKAEGSKILNDMWNTPKPK